LSSSCLTSALTFGASSDVKWRALLDSLYYYPRRWVIFELDLHALILIGIVFEMHLDPILKLDGNQPVVHNLASGDVGIHDVVEFRLGPPTFLPVGHSVSVTKQGDRRLDGKVHIPERELDVKLANTNLRRGFAHDAGQV